jgi:hypothetical protein
LTKRLSLQYSDLTAHLFWLLGVLIYSYKVNRKLVTTAV